VIDERERVVLVDEQGRELGAMDKLAAHREGRLHRAISVFVFDLEDRLILQRRAAGKYHSGGQWANTCCSHPRPGEDGLAAAHRRLAEELGFDCPLAHRTDILYQVDVGAGLVEHELVEAYVGRWAGPIHPDPNEASDWRAIAPDRLAEEIEAEPEAFAPWLRIYVRAHAEALFGPEAGAHPMGESRRPA
jgi:isopentenyl-diphosphate delta-isomerase type 1